MYLRKRTLVLGAAVLTILLVAASFLGGVVQAGTGFSDVPADHYFADEIEWMRISGVSGGYQDGTFRPGANVTRQAMAAFMASFSETFYLRQGSSGPTNGIFHGRSVACDAGDRALAGGGNTNTLGAYMIRSVVSPDGNAWEVAWQAENAANLIGVTTVVWVLCGPPPVPS